MKRKIFLIIFLSSILFQTVYGLNGKIIKQEKITDFSNFPYYSRIKVKIDGKRTLKPEFPYSNSVDIYRITYLSDGFKVNGYMTTPKKKGKYPCIIFNRGGNGEFGKIEERLLFHIFAPLSKEGFVVIGSQYRGNDGSEGQDEFGGSDINDVLNLIPALEDVKKADTSKIGILGGSRGGMMTYIALTKTDRIKAAVIWSGLSNAFTMIKNRPMMEKRVFSKVIPDYWENKDKELRKRSAVFWAEKINKTTPILLLHGSADWRVSPEEALEMADKLYEAKHPFRFVLFEGGDHGMTEHSKERDRLTLNWFIDYLKNDKPLPNLKPHGK